MLYTDQHPFHQMEATEKAQYIIRVLDTIPLHNIQNVLGINQKTGIFEELISLLRLIVAVENSEDISLKDKLNTLLSHDWGMNFSSSVETMTPFYHPYLEAADYYVHLIDLQASFISRDFAKQLNLLRITGQEKQTLSQALELICEWQKHGMTPRIENSINNFISKHPSQEPVPTDLKKAIDAHYQRAFRRLKELIKDCALPIATTLQARIEHLEIERHFGADLLRSTREKIGSILVLKQSLFSPSSTQESTDCRNAFKIQEDIALLSQKNDTVQTLGQAGINSAESFVWVDFSQQLMNIKKTCDTILFYLSQQGNQETRHLRFSKIDQALLSIETLRNNAVKFLFDHDPALQNSHFRLVETKDKDHITDNELIHSIADIEAICQTTAGIAFFILCIKNHENIIAEQTKRNPIIITHFSDQLRQLSLAAFKDNETIHKKPNLKPSAEYFNQLYTYTLTLFLASRIIDPSLHEGILDHWSRIALYCLDSQDYASFDAIQQSMKYFYDSLDKNTHYSTTVTENIQAVLLTSLRLEDRISRENQVVILDTRNISKGLERSKEIGGTEKLLNLLREAHDTAKNTTNNVQETAWQSQIQRTLKDQTLLHNGCISRIQQRLSKMTPFTRILDADAQEIATLNNIATFLNILDNPDLANRLWSHEDIDTIVNDLSTMEVARSIQGYLEDKGIDIDEETAYKIINHYAPSKSRKSSLADLALTSQQQNTTNPNNTTTTQRGYR